LEVLLDRVGVGGWGRGFVLGVSGRGLVVAPRVWLRSLCWEREGEERRREGRMREERRGKESRRRRRPVNKRRVKRKWEMNDEITKNKVQDKTHENSRRVQRKQYAEGWTVDRGFRVTPHTLSCKYNTITACVPLGMTSSAFSGECRVSGCFPCQHSSVNWNKKRQKKIMQKKGEKIEV
jgi:hypothetical protein